jgi:hypothetical protein
VSPDWVLMRRILTLPDLAAGLADTEIAERLGRPVDEVRQAARVLYRQRKVDFIMGCLVSVPPAEGRRPA